ncbi:TPA: ABC transporter ATP-binding protein [Candidatus Woesearchaeota archaeon]|nr:ABC transporter ATP-binding protein [Candidatus Woesearchaeota archaeon]
MKQALHREKKVTKKKPLLALRDVWKRYLMGEVALDVLKGISLEIYEGEFVAIVGPSGSGKSTLMNLLGILDVPTKGKVIIDDKDISTLTESDLAELRGKKIGFVFQQFNLIHSLTALENVVLPTIFQGIPEQVRLERAKKLLARVGLEQRIGHRPNELSGGQQQRVAIARSLINNPSIILADEPTGNLDSASGKQIMELLLQLHVEEKKTIILVTHDQSLVSHAQRVIRIKDGMVEKVEIRGEK